MDIGARIAELRARKGISQTELGELLGTTKQTVYKYETGVVTNIPLDRLERIAGVLEVSPAYLMGWEDRSPAPTVSDEAMKVARDYQGLDPWGQGLVRKVIGHEQERMADEERFLRDSSPEMEPRVINLFVEPSAAGIAVPTMGRDYELYELKPEDPQGAAYAVRVRGDSMAPDFPDGAVVFVNHDAMRDGDIGIFSVDGGTVCKQYHQEGGIVYLFSLNRERQDADVVLFPGGNRSFVCQGRVMTGKRYPVPGRG